MDNVFFPLSELVDLSSWGFSSVVPDGIDNILLSAPTIADEATRRLGIELALGSPLELRFPGIDVFSLVIGATSAPVSVELGLEPFSFGVRVPLILRLDASILRPVNSDNDPDMTVEFVDVTLGEVDFSVDADGHVGFDIGAASLPRCMVGTSGVILQVGKLKWITPSTAAANLPLNTPEGFTGLYLDDVEVEITGLPKGVNALRLDDAFIGTGGFSGKISDPNLGLDWDTGTQKFTGALHGELFGFQGGLSNISVEFRQNALVGCTIGGDVYVPWIEKVIGLELGLTGSGSISALARVPHSPSATGVAGGSGSHLLHIAIGGVMDVDLDAIRFEAPRGAAAFVEITGSIGLDKAGTGVELPAVGIKALRIDTEGHVAIDGGWLDIPKGKIAPFHGFPLEISRVGFGSEGSGSARRLWFGLNGGLKLADGLPVGASVEGLKLSWEPADPAGTLAVSLAGIGLELDIPKVVKFKGSVSFFDDGQNKGFRGNGKLTLPSVGLGIDVDLVIGRTQNDDTFFYFHLGVDLPVGIPLFQTGAAFYGFEGLVAQSMGPDRHGGEPWYWGWYVREPRGATDQHKWAVQPGAFAAGLGTTIGTLPDTAFTVNAKVLFILVLPGPVLLLEGKGSFLRKKPSGNEEGIFEALLALDVPAQTFQANLAATYSIEKLLKVHGGADVAFSWASPPPAHYWHVYLGEDQPMERRWQATLLSLFKANAYFMLERSGIRLGAWIGFDEDWKFGPVRVWAKAEISGEGEVSWDPAHFHGHLHLGGEAGVSAFGAKIVAGASADVGAEGPTPWHVHLALSAHIEIDLWLFNFEWSANIELDWKDTVDSLPQPALPIVERLAHQHLLVDENGDLENATVPPDSKTVVVFRRPVRDLPRIGAPGEPNLATEIVGPREFAYQLAHVALHRREGALWRVVAASGIVDVSGSTVTLPGGLHLQNAAGGQLTFVGGGTLPVTASAPGSIAVTGTPPSGPAAYRLRGPRPSASVQIASSAPIGAGLASLTLASSPGLAKDTLGGGDLTAGSTTWKIAGNQGTKIVVRTNPTAPTVPPTGPAAAVGPLGPMLEGAWMPDDQGKGATKLVIGARTPFAQFHNNTADVVDGWNLHNPDFACGPRAEEAPICIRFEGAPLGPVGQSPIPVDRLLVSGAGDAFFVPAAQGSGRVLRIGSRGPGHKQSGTASISFAPPVEKVWVHCSTEESGKVSAGNGGSIVDEQAITRDGKPLEFSRTIDRLDIEGTLIGVEEICLLPGWTCIGFDAASFPQGASGRVSYAGVTLESAGPMRVTGGVLVVASPPTRVVVNPPKASVLTLRDGPLPYARFPDRWTVVRPATPGINPVGPPVALEIPGVREAGDTRLPGIGLVTISPIVKAPMVRRDRGTRPLRELRALRGAQTVELRGDLTPSHAIALNRPAIGGRPPAVSVASVTIFLPQPVTRVRVGIMADANVSAFAGARLVASAVGAAGADVALAATGWIDRVTVTAATEVRVQRLCTDAGPFGWARFEQWNWREGVRSSLSAFTSDSPVLAPGVYRLDVVTGWADEAAPPASPSWSTDSAQFTVGPPPGLGAGVDGDHYPGGGPLNHLGTYVASTMPAPGDRPFYRSYDVAVAFSQDYVSRMFLENGTPITIAVKDANGRDVRPGSPNLWGRGPDLALTTEETQWLATLHGDGTTPCAQIDLSSVVRREVAVAGAGEMLLPAQLHVGVLQADGKPLHRFEFVTSRFGSFSHHLGHFDGARLITSAATIDPTALRAGVASAEQALEAARLAAAGAMAAVRTGSPTQLQFDAERSASAELAAARSSLRVARDAAMTQYLSAAGIPLSRPLPSGVEVSAVGNTILLESGEPLRWERLTLTARRSTVVPQVRTTITFPRQEFGGPDTGGFVYRGHLWSTTAELWARGDLVEARLPGAWTLRLEADGEKDMDVELHVTDGHAVTVHAAGTGVSADQVVSVPGGGVRTVTFTGNSIVALSLTGEEFGIGSVTLGTPFRPGPATGPLRLVDAHLPVSAADTSHSVDLVADAVVDLTGWRIEWRPADAGAAPRTYHTFTGGDTVDDGQAVRVFGGQAMGAAVPGYLTRFGGSVGTLDTAGMVFRLVDPTGTVVHELAAMPAGQAVSCVTFSNGDGTRGVVIPSAATITGWWTFAFEYRRDIGPTEPVLSVAGSTTAERAGFGFFLP